MVVCPGLQLDWHKVPGLAEAMNSPYASSNYVYELASKTWGLLKELRSGTAVFTMPSGPVKCGGASQKPMYLVCDYWRQQGVLHKIRVVLVVPTPTVYGVPGVDEELNRKIAEYGIELRCNSEVVAVDAEGRTVQVHDAQGRRMESLAYDVLHAVPPQSAPDWLKATSLPAKGESGGFVEVDPETLRHARYPNVWERRSTWILERDLFPGIYWNLILKGRA